MNLKTELIALAVRAFSEKTNLMTPPDTFDEFFATLRTGKSYDVRTAEQIETVARTIVQTAKKMNTDHKFKKITKHI